MRATQHVLKLTIQSVKAGSREISSNLAAVVLVVEVEPITRRPPREASELREIAESPSTHPEA